MVKLKKSKDKVKAKTKAVKPRFVFNPSILQKLVAQSKKIMGNNDNIQLKFEGKRVFVYVETTKGRLSLIDTECVKEGEGSLAFQMPYFTWAAAVKSRAELEITEADNHIIFSHGNYRAELHYSPVDKEFEVTIDEGLDATPIVALIENCGAYLGMRDHLMSPPRPLDIEIKWKGSTVQACQVDTYHALIIEGTLDRKMPSPSRVSLPQDIFYNLRELGGQLGFKERAIVVSSERGFGELLQLEAEASVISLEQAMAFNSSNFTTHFTLNGPEFGVLVDNAMEVTEWGNQLVMGFSSKGSKHFLSLNSAGRFGKVQGSIEIVDVEGTLPKSVSVSPNTMNDLFSMMGGNARISIGQQFIRVQPAQQDESWKVYGFAALTGRD